MPEHTRALPIIPLILAGGSGSRLWPVSRDSMPKQFLLLNGTRSTYQQALERVSRPDLFGPPIVMTSNDFRFFARRQAAQIGIDATIVLEPLRRDFRTRNRSWRGASARAPIPTPSFWQLPPITSSTTLTSL